MCTNVRCEQWATNAVGTFYRFKRKCKHAKKNRIAHRNDRMMHRTLQWDENDSHGFCECPWWFVIFALVISNCKYTFSCLVSFELLTYTGSVCRWCFECQQLVGRMKNWKSSFRIRIPFGQKPQKHWTQLKAQVKCIIENCAHRQRCWAAAAAKAAKVWLLIWLIVLLRTVNPCATVQPATHNHKRMQLTTCRSKQAQVNDCAAVWLYWAAQPKHRMHGHDRTQNKNKLNTRSTSISFAFNISMPFLW